MRLRVALFPYLPDAQYDHFKSLNDSLVARFERAHPEVQLILRPKDSANFYDPGQLNRWLTSDSGYDIVEADAEILGDLVAAKAIRPWPSGKDTMDWHPAARRAVRIDGVQYGIPHWLCAFILFSRDRGITRAQTAAELVHNLDGLANGPRPRLAGDLNGKWQLSSIYLDSWLETYGPSQFDKAVAPPLDSTVVQQVVQLARECRVGTSNPCLTTWHDTDLAQFAFGRGETAALVDYSEALWRVITLDTAARHSMSLEVAPLGAGRRPALFVDVFVRRSECSGPCEQAAESFVRFMDTPETQSFIIMSEDGRRGVPRYLLPATLSAYETPSVRGDAFYRTLSSEIRDGYSFPNAGLSATGDTIKQLLVKAINGT
jgi:thiamine pyridinylase